MITIYLITNLKNGKYYVGKTKQSLTQRFKEHVKVAYKLNRDYRRHLQFAIRYHGAAAFVIEPLVLTESQEEANRQEILWILILNSTNQLIGYNLSSGGDGFNDATGQIRKKISRTLTGRKISPETIHKRSASQRGKKRGPYSSERRAAMSIAKRIKRFHGPELPPEMIRDRMRKRMSDAAKERWTAGRGTEGSLAALVVGRTPENAANARKTLEAIPREQRIEMLRRASNIRWERHRQRLLDAATPL